MSFVSVGHMIMSSAVGLLVSPDIENHSMMMTSLSRLARSEFAGGMRKISYSGGGFGSSFFSSSSSSSCSSSCLKWTTTRTHNSHRGGFLVSKQIRRESRSRSMVAVHNHHQTDHDEIRSSSISTSNISTAKEKVRQVIVKQAVSLVGVGDINNKETINTTKPTITSRATTDGDQSHVLTNQNLLNEAYNQCSRYCGNATTFYMAFSLMTPEKKRAICALYAWGHRMDDFVDEPNASVVTTLKALDEREQRLIDLYEGHPHDIYDAAVSDTVSKYHIDIQLFKDLIEGMRMDLNKSRYKNFDELYLYSYYVAGTFALMSVPIIGICPDSKAPTESVYESAMAFAVAGQLTNILRDVGEDAKRGRIYLPQDELALAGLSDDDIFHGKVTNKWRDFMKGQIKRARMYYDEAEKGVNDRSSASRWSMWAALMIYRQILDEIEANDYDNFTKRASVPHAKKLIFLPVALARGAMRM